MALTLYLDSAQADKVDWVEAELKDMLVGYERILINPNDVQAQFGQQVSLPVLQDGPRQASGQAELSLFLKEFRNFAEQWRMFQSDSCYVSDDGNC